MVRSTLMTVLVVSLASAPLAARQNAPAPSRGMTGTLPDGARWQATVPANWNGTLLLWSHGYARTMPAAKDAPDQDRDALLEAGFALAGSTYATAGWALKSAVPDQLATLSSFTAKFGKPKQVIAWGMSMGGLVTTAIAEHRPRRVDGALAMCGSIGGAVGMMNMALDGAYAFRLLVAPDAGIQLTRVDDDGANARRVATALEIAQTSPAGRARVALAAVLAGLPGWTTPADQPPADSDYAGQEAEMAKTFVMGVFLPRTDQEKRAGGGFSWNDGVDYRAQLKRSGRMAMVRALYAGAGLDLDADLARLNAGRRVTADKPAVAYMMAHYTPDGEPQVPMLAVQNIGDGLTSPSLQRGYLDAAARRAPGVAAGLWVHGAGHCRFSTATILASIKHLRTRLDSGSWPARPVGFVEHMPPPMLRVCIRGGICR